MPSVYRRLLGPALDSLPEALRRFHDVETEWHGHARFRITRGRGRFRNLLASVGGFPPAGEDVPVRLHITAEGDRERWVRQIGSHRLESVQWPQDGLLMESIGAVRLSFRPVVDPPALRLEPGPTWVLGLPCPRLLSPRGGGVEVGRPEGCDIVAWAEVPLLGRLAQYEGLLVAD